jgi:hypothetical protein
MTLSIKNTKYNRILPYAECHYARCDVLFIVTLNVVMLIVIKLNVDMLMSFC